MPYRQDIEGLRGVAVAMVLLFHLGLAHSADGFLGVDIFFVLSGYLITQILLRDLGSDGFSLVGFYRRRVVRILPALLTMIVLVCAAGSLILLPVEIAAMARSGAAAAGFVSNFLFWSADGYFDQFQIRPLLHSWSLGVEEQYYLLYPLALYALWRWARTRIVLALWIATLGSLGLSWLLTRYHPDAAFFLLPSRGWELGLGALAAAGGFPAIRAGGVRAVLAGGGLVAMLVAPLLLPMPLTTAGFFPVPGALPVCIGAALLVAYGAEAPTARLLALAPLVWIGRISYSLYLWHYPVIALYKAAAGPQLGNGATAMLALVSVALAALSYWLVETPFRRRFRERGDPRRIAGAGIAACLAVGLGCLGLAAAAPVVRPLPPEVAKVAAYAGYRGTAEFEYQFGPVDCYGATQRYAIERCLVPDPAKRNIVVIGDSYAAHLWRALAERFPDDRVMLAASGGCRPLIGAGGLALCREMVARVMREAVRSRRVQAVVLAGHWQPNELRLLGPTIRAIEAQGASVTVIGPVETYRTLAPRVAAMALLRHDPAMVDREQLGGTKRFDPMMRAAAESAGARYYSLYDQECPGGHCRLLTGTGVPFHFDEAHLTLDGSRELMKAMPAP